MELVRRIVDGQAMNCFLQLDKSDKGVLHVQALLSGLPAQQIAVRILAYNAAKRHVAIEMLGKVFRLRIVNVGSKEKLVCFLDNAKKRPVVVAVAAEKLFAGARRDRNDTIKLADGLFVSDKKSILNSPLVGRVVRLFVKEGDFVKKGSQLISIESMKMENILYAHGDLFIKSILISEADVVQTNQGLMIFDEKRGYDECSTESSPKKKV